MFGLVVFVQPERGRCAVQDPGAERSDSVPRQPDKEKHRVEGLILQ